MMYIYKMYKKIDFIMAAEMKLVCSIIFLFIFIFCKLPNGKLYNQFWTLLI
jgi:hypothetical protein